MKNPLRLASAALCLLPLVSTAANAPPDPVAMLAANTHTFRYAESGITGPGAELLGGYFAKSQFVLLGEDHMDHAVPEFAGALFRTLHDAHGYRHVVVEQDPIAMEDALAPVRRGDAGKLAAHARLYPSLFEFDTDEDLTFLAQVSNQVKGPDALWGVEQTTGAIRYLEELGRHAHSDDLRQRLRALEDAARAADPGPTYSVKWLIAEGTSAKLAELAPFYGPKADARSRRLYEGLVKSAEIFGYYRRAEAGEWVGLYNNTVREEVLKANFLARYHAAAKRGPLPKALFKFGANHLYRGKNPTQAYPIGNLAHELAIVNGSEAVGLMVLPLGPNYRKLTDYPAWMHPLLPAAEPTEPVVVNLRPLRPYTRLFREKVAVVADQWMLRDLINGYDAIVLLPGSRPGERRLGGR
jgi:hypothetical protein